MTTDWQAINREILTRLDIRAEAESLGVRFTGESPNSDGWVSCHAIDREDNSPSAGMCVAGSNGQLGQYTDHATDDRAISFWELAARLGKFSDWKESRNHYASVAGVKLPGPGRPKKSLTDQIELIPHSEAVDLKFSQWAKSKPPIDPEAVKAAGGRLCRWPVKSREPFYCIAFASGVNQSPNGIILYRADCQDFAPFGKTLTQRKTHLVGGSKDGWIIFGRNGDGKPVRGRAALESCGTIWRVEGIPDALALYSQLGAGQAVVTNTHGAKAASKLPMSWFGGKTVYAVGDADRAGVAGNDRFAHEAAYEADRLFVCHLPYAVEEKHGKDVRDYLSDGRSLDELVASAERVDRERLPTVIEVTPEEWKVNDAAIGALAGDADTFQRGGQLVGVIHSEAGVDEGGIDRPEDSPRIAPLSAWTIRERLTRHCRFIVTSDGGDQKQVNPPEWCYRAVADRGQWKGIRRLRGNVDHPILRPDGTILGEAGYDESTRLIYTGGIDVDIPDRPTRADAKRAAAELLDVVCDFPFQTESHRSTWLALLLTPLARQAFAGPSPLFLADANVRGSGKSLLCSLVSHIVTGKPFARMTNPRDDEEFRKRITSLAIAGDRLILIDNISGSLGCASLDAALTSTSWKDRILGKSETVELPLDVTWCASGNNVILRADTSRRVAHIRLQSPMENPEEREDFKHKDIAQHVVTHRSRLLSAALTILRAYSVAGRPQANLKPWGSFEGWSDLVRQAVVWCGLADPGEAREELRSTADTEAQAIGALLHNWHYLDPAGEGVKANDILYQLGQRGNSEGFDVIKEAVCQLCNVRGNDLPGVRSLGNKLKRIKGRIIGGLALDCDYRKRVAIWQVVNTTTNQTHQTHQNGIKGESGESSESTGHCPTRGKINNSTGELFNNCSLEGYSEDSPDTPDSPIGNPNEFRPGMDYVEWTNNGEDRF